MVTITYAIDAHVGQRVTIWRTHRTRAGEVLCVALAEGRRRLVPVEWTDRRPSAVPPRVDDRIVLLDATRLLAIAKMADEKLTILARGSESTNRRPTATEVEGASVGARGDTEQRHRATVDRADRARRRASLAGGSRKKSDRRRRRDR